MIDWDMFYRIQLVHWEGQVCLKCFGIFYMTGQETLGE